MNDIDFLFSAIGLAAFVFSVVVGILLAYTAVGLLIGIVSREPSKR